MKRDTAPDTPTAAVALVVTREIPSILLVRRAENPVDPSSGHWAFPGGRIDDSDGDLLETCRREVEEECGCLLTSEYFKQSLPLSHAGRKHNNPVIVAPFLWEIPSPVVLSPDMTEITETRWLELKHVHDQHNHRIGRIAPGYADRDFPYIMVGNTPLWGFTYRVLMDYLELSK